jgi:hypothetical protein
VKLLLYPVLPDFRNGNAFWNAKCNTEESSRFRKVVYILCGVCAFNMMEKLLLLNSEVLFGMFAGFARLSLQ